MEKLVADLSARIKSLEKESIILQKEAQESRAIANRAILECATSSNPAPTPREPKVVFPDKFDGSRRHLRGFLNQLELIFRIQPLTYSSEQLRIATVGTLLSEELNLVHPNGRVPRWPFLHSFVLGRLQERHDQYVWYRRSDSRIHLQDSCLGQGSQPCASYVATFRQLATDLEWNDSALQSQFYWGLNSEVKDALVHFEQPTSLSDAMTLAIKIDNRIQERRREQTQSARPLSQRSSNYVPCPRRAPYQPREPNYQQRSSSNTNSNINTNFVRVPNKLLDSTCCKATRLHGR
ncbi:hypothetical protein BASA83_009089 [Batrachochytrium salamandrivorans]|nr:hypothetical protein BASA83_009089 [Batrachochytrium salamandrivorans]